MLLRSPRRRGRATEARTPIESLATEARQRTPRRIAGALVAGALVVAPVALTDDRASAARSDASVFAYGSAGFYGSPQPDPYPALVGVAALPNSNGYWLARADGGVYHYGEARYYGSMSGRSIKAPISGIAATPSGKGYWLFGWNGSVYHFGDAGHFGSASAIDLDSPIVAMAATPTGRGYWLVSAAGGVYRYGDAGHFGSVRALDHTGNVTGIAATASGRGYWMATTTGGVFSFGDATFHGSLASFPLPRPVVGIARTPAGGGYWVATADGRAFAFGDAVDLGEPLGGIGFDRQAIDFAAPSIGGQGYWFLAQQLPADFTLLGPGASGARVVQLQQRLLALGYWVTVDGQFGSVTQQAVYAFQKYERLARTGSISVDTNNRLARARRPVPRSASGDLIELDKARQIIFIVRGGRTHFVFNTSTGNDRPYVADGQLSIANTPTGRFSIIRQIDGLRISRLGELWRPKYWTPGGIAFHGSRSIPPYPASHGCSRLSYPAIDYIWATNLMPLGSPVWSY